MAKAWFPFYLNDYLADTPLLSLAEHGAFCLLMMFYWNSDASAPASADRLHKICRCTTDAERDAVDHVVQEYFSVVDGKLVNSRLDKELAKSVSISASRSRAAKAKHAKASTSAPASAEQVHTQSQSQSQSQDKPKPKTVGKRFAPPTLQEVKDYCQERSNFVDPEKFIDFYESKGWMVGKNKMKSWQASVRTWEKDSKPEKENMTISKPIGGFREFDLK